MLTVKLPYILLICVYSLLWHKLSFKRIAYISIEYFTRPVEHGLKKVETPSPFGDITTNFVLFTLGRSGLVQRWNRVSDIDPRPDPTRTPVTRDPG